MLEELMKKGYGKKEKYNCAQKILYGANEAYNLKLDEKALSLAAGFGGGMAIESVCGALTASIMVLSNLFKDKYEKEDFRKIISQFLDTYKNKMGDINCRELKDRYYNEVVKCDEIIVQAAQLLDYFVKTN
ncbi:C-GCAxxG-C-C family (seleno)protein [Abyssisolibacter fermentans]|uniref:C-GCAxxG-C-C family (seleno)protein n=1 Tax=Abyssisolibacter fermentans TaxID=1766203 RepID=UPI0008324E17|nr:C-GCAxxG-C-C family (seleno)protein [Abyssisolibacter fermentans]